MPRGRAGFCGGQLALPARSRSARACTHGRRRHGTPITLDDRAAPRPGFRSLHQGRRHYQPGLRLVVDAVAALTDFIGAVTFPGTCAGMRPRLRRPL